MCGGVVVRPCRDGASASGRGVLSMHGLSHGVVRVNTGSNLTSLTLQDCGQVLPGGLYISPYVSVCLLHICRTVDRCCQKVCISLCAFLSVCLFVCVSHVCRTVDRCCQEVCIFLRTSVCLSVCVSHVCRTVDRCYQEGCISLCAFLSVSLFLLAALRQQQVMIFMPLVGGRKVIRPVKKTATHCLLLH